MDWCVRFSKFMNVQVPVLNAGSKDKAVWVTNFGKKTEYATRVVWKDMRYNGSTVGWKDLVWFPQNIPRHSFVIWMAVQERLMTQDRIAAWKHDDELRCVFCKQCQDSHEHLFFQCQFSHSVWSKMQDLIDKRFSYNWKDIIDEFSRLKSNRNIWNVVRRIVLGALV